VSREASEILVLGGGPAGCTAARLLSLWGHGVRLVARPAADGGVGLAESLIPSCGKFFDLLGVREAVDSAGFVRTNGNTVWWGRDEARVEVFAGGAQGWQVTAPRLEAVLRRAALEAGVRLEERVATPDEAAALPARFRIDCTGRGGLLARSRAGRIAEPGHRTVALSAVWRSQGRWEVPDPSHTLVESYADGWVWSVADRLGCVDVLLDALRRGGLDRRWRRRDLRGPALFGRREESAGLRLAGRDRGAYGARAAGDGGRRTAVLW
jgi:halogenation protein CepH